MALGLAVADGLPALPQAMAPPKIGHWLKRDGPTATPDHHHSIVREPRPGSPVGPHHSNLDAGSLL